MEKTVKRVSIWKPLVLSICLLMSAQHKVYADIPMDEFITYFVLPFAVVLTLLGVTVTVDDNKKESSSTPSSSAKKSYSQCEYEVDLARPDLKPKYDNKDAVEEATKRNERSGLIMRCQSY